MTRQDIINELNKQNVKFTKVRFYQQSRWQKGRYKPSYVGWETWIYTNTSRFGYLITQETWENKKIRQNAIDSIKDI